jgi:integrase/recombinase XerD
VTLKKAWTFEEVLPAPKPPHKLPVVLSPLEVARFLGCVDDIKHHAILTTCYACAFPRLFTSRSGPSTAGAW